MKRRDFVRTAAGLLVPAGMASAAPLSIMGGPGRLHRTSNVPSVPVNTGPPVISGSAAVGSTLSCTTGTWTNSPTSYAYQWLRDGDPISGATSSTYQLQQADEGEMVSCVVTATNAAGSASQVSNEVGPVEEAGDGQLPAGHWMAEKAPMRVIYPRPDAETSSWARHHWAYYDGSAEVEYRIPVGVQFGAFPYQYSVAEGPAGVTVDTDGIVRWVPVGSASSATINILVTDQAGATINVIWTVSTTSSTSRFVFIAAGDSAVPGNDTTGTGSISQPYLTLAKALSSAPAGSIVVCRGGSYSVPASAPQITTSRACAYVGFPGESAVWNFTAGGLTSGSTPDIFFDDLTWDDGFASAANFKNLSMEGATPRRTFSRVRVTNPKNGTVVDDNATAFFSGNPSIPTYTDYQYFVDCTETGRVRTGNGNCAGLFIMFQPRYLLASRCHVTGAGGHDLFIKSSAFETTRRECSTLNSGSETSFSTPNQINNGLASGRIEDCYNTIRKPSGGAAVELNWGVLSQPGQHWFYRNSVIGRVNIRAGSNTTPDLFLLERNAIQASSPQVTRDFSDAPAVGPSITITGRECEGSSGVLDASGQLIGSNRASYLGTRGAEIA